LININDKTVSVNEVQNQIQNRGGCGQATADCITSAYTEQGWYSVAGWIITGFQPWFGVAVATGCAGLSCL